MRSTLTDDRGHCVCTDTFPATDITHSLIGRGFDAYGILTNLEQVRHYGTHGRYMGHDLGPLQYQGGIHITNSPSTLIEQVYHGLQEMLTIRSFPTLVRIREVLADITQGQRA